MRTRAFLALLAVVVPVAVLTACSKDKPQPPAESHAEAVHDFGSLSLEQVDAKMAEAKAGKLALAFIDNNTKERYTKSHVPGARWVQFNEVKASDLPADKDTTLIFYCSNER